MARDSRPSLCCIIPGLKGKQSAEQVVVGGFSRRLQCNVWWQLGGNTGCQSPQPLASDICCVMLALIDLLWHIALTVQPRAKLVNAITSFPSVAKGTEEEKEKKG